MSNDVSKRLKSMSSRLLRLESLFVKNASLIRRSIVKNNLGCINYIKDIMAYEETCHHHIKELNSLVKKLKSKSDIIHEQIEGKGDNNITEENTGS